MTTSASPSASRTPTARSAPDRRDDAERLEALRQMAATRPDLAGDLVWEWLHRFRDLATHPRLGALFTAGTLPSSLEGDCRGIVLGLYGATWLDGVDRLVRVGQRLRGTGWTGKSFDESTGRGFNRLTKSSIVPMFLAMPLYRFTERRGELIGFHFEHRDEPGALDPTQQVRAITYDGPGLDNPLVLPRTRDEVVELVPNVFLGRALLREGTRHHLVGYFAMRRPVTGSARRGG